MLRTLLVLYSALAADALPTLSRVKCRRSRVLVLSDANMAVPSVGPLPTSLSGRSVFLSGPVANGFGRGSRKLGIPTANLPCSLFQEQLSELPCGVYVGWARVRGGVHKAVCNVGFSPTFEGAENPEKIVEAHLIETFDKDFYEEIMSLLLLGYIRDERKFSGIEELLSTIRADIACASADLDKPPHAELATAAVLRHDGATVPIYRILDAGCNELSTLAEDDGQPQTGAADCGPAPPEGFIWGGEF